MLVDHDVFVQAVKGNKKIIVTYFSGQQHLFLTKLCIPVEFNSAGTKDSSGCYYFWDSEADIGQRLLALEPSRIKNMEESNEIFNPKDYIIPETDQTSGR